MGKLPPPPLLKHLLQRSGKSDLTWADWYQKVQAGIITGAPTDASYVTTKANSSLSGEINLGALASGFLQSTASGGVATLSTTPIIPQSAGGTGKNTTTATDGQLLIGRSSDHSLNLAALLAGSGISVTNGPSSVTIGNTSPAPTPPPPGQYPFPAVQNPSTNPNTLDDYAEGNWAPTDQSGAGLVFSSIVGEYVKIGRIIAASTSFLYPATANAAAVVWGGLPRPSGGSQMWGGYRTYGPYGGAPLMLMVLANSQNIYVSTAAGQATNNSFSSQILNFVVVYLAAQ
jgi:hypothetical protein